MPSYRKIEPRVALQGVGGGPHRDIQLLWIQASRKQGEADSISFQLRLIGRIFHQNHWLDQLTLHLKNRFHNKFWKIVFSRRQRLIRHGI